YGYQLLGAIIESVTGKSFQRIATEFLRSHGLNSSYVETADLLIRNRARHYRTCSSCSQGNAPTLLREDLLVAEGYWSSGGLLSTVGDLLKYANGLVDSYNSNRGFSGKYLSSK